MLTVLTRQMKLYADLVKFSHTIFALPFALSMLVVLAQRQVVTIQQLLWILLSLVTARTAAMAFNRLVDRAIDARNPRTSNRELPAGKLNLWQVYILLIFSIMFFVYSAAKLGTHCLMLTPFVLLVLLGYSLTKRFTSAAHLFLGLALSLAPGGVWYAITAQWSWLPTSLMLGVLFWVAGFDILYSCQDYAFDKQNNLFSVPVRYGINHSFLISRILHIFSLVALFLFGVSFKLGITYYIGLALFAVVLASQHFLIKPTDLSRIDAAFFTRNGIASVVFLITVVIDQIYGS